MVPPPKNVAVKAAVQSQRGKASSGYKKIFGAGYFFTGINTYAQHPGEVNNDADVNDC